MSTDALESSCAAQSLRRLRRFFVAANRFESSSGASQFPAQNVGTAFAVCTHLRRETRPDHRRKRALKTGPFEMTVIAARLGLRQSDQAEQNVSAAVAQRV